ncbi:MAG: hypothetical protein J6C15_10300 [Bacteroidaceae bacterium]|nr:hypothetical protein [Bacteroidaceae bacterium]
MKKYFFTLSSFALLLSMAGCGSKSSQSEATKVGKDSLTTATVSKDSTLYGTSDEFGMSTFTMITKEGDTLNVTRTAEDGTDGNIYGDLKEGEEYALITRDNNEAIVTLINLTQLNKFVKDYAIHNGHLILKDKNGLPDTVKILQLNKKLFAAQGRETYNYHI